jgi:hypothetical protein
MILFVSIWLLPEEKHKILRQMLEWMLQWNFMKLNTNDFFVRKAMRVNPTK